MSARELPAIDELLRRAIGEQAERMERNLPGALLGVDPECVHDLRVATRRARFALRLAQGGQTVAPAGLREELAWIARLLGAVRDWDVFIERLRPRLTQAHASPAARRFILTFFRKQRSEARAALEPALRSPRFEALLLSMHAAAVGEAETGGISDALGLADAAIAKAARRARRAAQSDRPLTAEQLHLLRIAGKRLRYTCEFFAELYAGRLDAPIRRLVRLQDLLGGHQDAVVAQQRLHELAERVNLASPAARDRLATLGALTQIEREDAACLREAFAQRWKKTRRTIAELRRFAPPPPPADEAPPAAAAQVSPLQNRPRRR